MKFYILSFILHIIVIFSVFQCSAPEGKIVDSKNVTVYLNELNMGPAQAPPALHQEKKEEKKEEVKPKKKKTIKKEEKKNPKRVKAVKEEKIQDTKEESVEEETVQAPSNPFSGMGVEGGTYVGDQKNMGGFGYQIRREVDPKYPMMAKKVGFKDEVVIKTKFLVGLDGKVEKVIFLDNFERYGFHKEVEKALYKWEFAPIIYHGKPIKMYFYKDFRFNVKNG